MVLQPLFCRLIELRTTAWPAEHVANNAKTIMENMSFSDMDVSYAYLH